MYGRWRDLLILMKHPAAIATKKLSGKCENVDIENGKKATLAEWRSFLNELECLERRMLLSSNNNTDPSSLAFAFIEGALVRALEDGDWVLLDEINLAPTELLDCLGGLLDSASGSITLVDRG